MSFPADLTRRSDIIKIIFAIFLPPLGVFLERGCNADFLINILLTVLGYIPGIIHALYVFPFLPKLPSRGQAPSLQQHAANRAYRYIILKF